MSFEALQRPDARGGERLGAWDDLPVHQSAALLGAVAPGLPGWSERFYFNIIAETGEVLAIMGGGVYPLRGVAECYFCRMQEGDRQVNVRAFAELPAPGKPIEAGPFSLTCDTPLRDWTVRVELDEGAFVGHYGGVCDPYLFEPVDVAADEPGGPFDLYRHFIQVGRWELESAAGIDASGPLTGVRDRTWGVRTRRIRWHNWEVFHVAGATITLIHQELADGTIMHSEAGVVHPDGRVDHLAVAGHDLRYDPQTRQLGGGTWSLTGEAGTLELEFERVGTAMRLAGAGYDDNQGERAPGALQRDSYDLADPDVARSTGRGTMDAGARVRAAGLVSGEGVGVVESAIARNHVTYGAQVG